MYDGENFSMEPFLGVLRIAAPFTRAAGDAANASTWPFPVKIKTLEGSTVSDVVSQNHTESSVQGWIQLIEEFIEEGAVAVITCCGFLAAIHPILKDRFPGFPIGTSSLLQIPIAQNFLPSGKRIGVVTFDDTVLAQKHFLSVGVEYLPPIVGIKPGCALWRLIRENDSYDYNGCEQSTVEAALELVKHENIGGIVLECANMPPYRAAVHKATGLPVWDISTLGAYVYEIGLYRAYQ